MNTNNKHKKVYRMALYGLPASGKTCLLATLAMPRISHPSGYSCVWQPVYAENQMGKQDQYLLNLHQRSYEWLEKAIHKISERELPEPNPVSDEYFSFEYSFTASTHQTFCIEIIDYSGELINPVNCNSTLAKNLRQKLITMDGVLVLAEAPYRDRLGHTQCAIKNCDGQAHTDLYQLQQTFSLLRDEKPEGSTLLDLPIALLVNKWDRYSDIDYANPAKEQNKLEEFLNSNPPPPHKGILDLLHFSVSEGNFKVFPVSALGENEFVRLDNGEVVERPKQVNPLSAFALEEAFIWLAQRRDAIDFQQFVEKGTYNKKCQKTALELLSRFPKESEQAKQINAVRTQCQKANFLHLIYTLIAIIALLFVTETTIDFKNYHQHIVAINNPNTTPKQLEKAENWLTQYVAAPYFRHSLSRIFLLSQNKAQNTLERLQTFRDKFLWEPVITALEAKNLPAAKIPALEYLKSYPHGPHAEEALDIKLRAEIQQQQRENEDAFLKIDRQVPDHWQEPDKIRQFLKELHQLPVYPEAETKALREKRIALENQLVELLDEKDWEIFVQTYKNCLKNGNFKQAAQSLHNRKPETSALKDLKESFKASVIKKIQHQVVTALEKARFDEVLVLLKDYDNYPSSLQTDDGKKKIAALQEQVLYEQVRKQLGSESIQKYLQNAPVKKMEGYVLAYQDYLEKTAPNLVLNVRLKLAPIDWKIVEDDDNTISVYLDGEKIIHSQVNVSPNTREENIKISQIFPARLSEPLFIKVKVVNEGIMFDSDYGEGSVTKSVKELAKGYHLELKQGHEVTAIVFLQILDYPIAPDLPEWDSPIE